MNRLRFPSHLALLLCVWNAGPAGHAQQPGKAPKPKASVQSQIDELRAGQQVIVKELEEIKALLKERTGRVEVGARPAPPSFLSVSVLGEPFKGDTKARVAIMEYSDFDCTFCGRYALSIYPALDAKYVKTGKVKYFFRDLPMAEHPNALFKARVARCAGDQGKFWEMHDRLFADQKPLGTADLAELIRSLSLDGAAFSECLTSEKFTQNIRMSANSAERMRINGTPAFLIGALSEDGNLLQATKVFLGAESLESFQKVLEELLESPPGK